MKQIGRFQNCPPLRQLIHHLIHVSLNTSSSASVKAAISAWRTAGLVCGGASVLCYAEAAADTHLPPVTLIVMQALGSAYNYF